MACPIDKGRDLRVLVLQPTPFCNINCSYCYLSERKLTATMALETVDQACRLVFESPRLDRQLEVAWHGGEPLVVQLDWYEKAFEVMERRRPPALELTHRFQTNGVLLDVSWARFFARTGARVGLSIDGPARLHDVNRRTRGGRGTHESVMHAARILQDHAVPFHVITVLTESALDAPEDLFEFYVENGIKEIGFNIEEIEGENETSSLERADTEQRFRRFLGRFFELVWASPGLLKVRELESVLAILLRNEPVVDEQNVPFSIVSVSVDGAVSTFSPELSGARHSRFGGFSIGRVATRSLSDCENEPQFLKIANEIRTGVELCKRDCKYFRWCGGGAPANKLYETGRFDVTETMHCRLTRQIVLDEVLNRLEARITCTNKEKESRLNHIH
jgi:uncharacterized protein